MNGLKIYSFLKMDKEQEQLKLKSLSSFPNGEIAKDEFWRNFYTSKTPTEESRLISMDEYIKRFNDSSVIIKDNFYASIISVLLDKSLWSKISKYELLMYNKLNAGNLYNNFAWKSSGEQLNNLGTNLEIAKALSKKSLNWVDEQIKNPELNNGYGNSLQATQNNFGDTYALILYKLNEFDSAFYYQNLMD